MNIVALLTRNLEVHTSTIFSAPATAHLISSPDSSASGLSLPSPFVPLTTKQRDALTAACADQHAHNARSLARACAGITAFRVRDPDPYAVDGGAVLGVRIEIVARARFLRPYYVLLNRPWAPESQALRVHRHTVPAGVSVGGLATRHLPVPSTGKAQDLGLFVRALRREVARYHARLGGIADMRRAVGLEKKAGEGKGKQRASGAGQTVVYVGSADPEARHVQIEWEDGRTGRLVLGSNGKVEKLAVFQDALRDRATARELLADGSTIEDVAQRLGTV
jgi:central kinetochore subunit Mal2/MCM21